MRVESPGDAELQLRGAFAELLAEAAQLRRRNNQLQRAAHDAVRPQPPVMFYFIDMSKNLALSKLSKTCT